MSNYNKLLVIFEESFNFKLSFSTMSKKEFYKFIKVFKITPRATKIE